VEGDENTRYFHSQASQHLCHNCIRMLDIGGVTVASYEAKVAAMHAYYELLGRTMPGVWGFDLALLDE
jgi:hypothetical protein